jgi:hypothetical protein
MYSPLSDREGFQGVVILLSFSREPLDTATRAKRIGELADRKNAFAVQPSSFFVWQIGEEA